MSDYYEIAYNDYLYLKGSEYTAQYNNLCTGAQQVAEKLLKSVAERVLNPDSKELLNSHNLRLLYRKIREEVPDFKLRSEANLVVLKDMYFDVRYPGENYFTATEQDYQDCQATMEDIIQSVNRFRNNNHLPVHDFTMPKSTFRALAAQRVGEDFADILVSETPVSMQSEEYLDDAVARFKERHWK